MWILSEKMWFHLKLLFAKNMRKAERALAFRISGSKCPFLTYLLLRYSSKSFTNHRSDDHCNDHFAQISRNERNDTDCKCCAYCIAGLEAEPCCSKCVADCSSDDHSEIWIPRLVNLSMTIPAMIAIGINPMMYPPVGPASLASPPVNPENTGSPTNPSNR